MNFPFIKSKGQDYIVIKVGGSLNVDDKFVPHYTGATASGINVVGYYWDDSTIDGVLQAKHFLTTIQGKDIVFLEIDFEQWWADWDKWLQSRSGAIPESEVPVVPSDKIYANFVAFYNYVVANTNLNVVVYTATWFLNKYCPEAYDFLKDKYTHWADYSYFNTTPVFATWEQLDALAPVNRPIPRLPTDYPLDKVLMHQWSGDKFTADGVWGDTQKTKYSALDLNLWVNKTISIDTFSKLPGATMPPITKDTFIASSKPLQRLNVPYLSQLGPGASNYANDCGAAAGAMLVQGYTDQKPTVDQFYADTGQKVDAYLNASQIIGVLSKYGVASNWKLSGLPMLLVDLGSGRPVICLVLYGTLVDAGLTENKTFKAYHFMTVVGYDTKNILVHDPLWAGPGGSELAIPQGIFDRAWQRAGASGVNPAYGCIVPESVLGIVTSPITPPTSTYTNYRFIASHLYIRSTPDDSIKTNIIGLLNNNDIVRIESIDSQGWGKLYQEKKYVGMHWLVKI